MPLQRGDLPFPLAACGPHRLYYMPWGISGGKGYESTLWASFPPHSLLGCRLLSFASQARKLRHTTVAFPKMPLEAEWRDSLGASVVRPLPLPSVWWGRSTSLV